MTALMKTLETSIKKASEPLSSSLSTKLIAEARRAAREQRSHFVSILSEELQRDIYDLALDIAHHAGVCYLAMQSLSQYQPTFHSLSLDSMLAERILVLDHQSEDVLVVVSDPYEADLLERVRVQIHGKWQLAFALEADIFACLSRYEKDARALNRHDTPLESDAQRHGVIELRYASIVNETNAVVKFVNSTIYDALKSQASDIHLETIATGIAVKYRIDGVLDAITQAPQTEFAEQVISRLKVLSELDIAERRIPQDGSLSISFEGRDIDLRISVMPSIFGEDVVIRILDKRTMMDRNGALRLETLGFPKTALDKLRQLSELPYGMLLVTGPTGSGKTTSLYAALTEIHTQREKIITIEDPVEYQLPGILQIPVNEKKGLSFAKGLRSILRHDPDIIMVGEIRDRETAEIAIQSALTGHLVFTTVHANSVYDVFGRFTHMGVDLYAFVSSLNGIVAQRLVRKNCPRCSAPYTPSEHELQRAKLSPSDIVHYKFAHGAGCGECRGTGYKGRRAIAEVLTLNDELREMIIERKSIRSIKEEAQRQGIVSLREAALALVAQGETSLEEVNKTVLHV